MATVKICTTGGHCIRCADTSTQKVLAIIEKLKKDGKLFICCGSQCVAVAHVDIITEESGPAPPDDDEREKYS